MQYAVTHAESDGVDERNVVTALACSLQGEEREVRPVRGTRFARLVAGGMVIEATADDAPVEVLELPSNDFFVLSLFQPQVGALAGKPPHPLLREFVRCAAAAARSAWHGTIST